MECYTCGLKGHKAINCRNQKCLANKNWECGCKIDQLRQLNFDGPTKTHCCECGKIESPAKMEWNYAQNGRMRCMECKFGREYTSQPRQKRFPEKYDNDQLKQ